MLVANTITRLVWSITCHSQATPLEREIGLHKHKKFLILEKQLQHQATCKARNAMQKCNI